MRRSRPSSAGRRQSERGRSRPIRCESSFGWLGSPCSTMPPFPRHLWMFLDHLLDNRGNLEVTVIVVATPRIELRPASGAARVTLHVLQNRQHCAAGAAEYCLLVPFTLGPDCYRMIGERQVAIFASIVKAATLHLDRNNVSRPVIMLATSL